MGLGIFTCRRPGTSLTALPSALIQVISGRGFPVAAHSTTVPVVLEKSTRFGGSFRNTGPDSESSPAKPVDEQMNPISFNEIHSFESV